MIIIKKKKRRIKECGEIGSLLHFTEEKDHSRDFGVEKDIF